MKKLIHAVLVTCLIAPTIQAQDVLIFSSTPNAVAKVGERVLTEAYEKIGRSISVKHLPAERALMMSNHGDVDGEVNRVAAISSQYPNLVMVPVPVSTVEGVVFTKDKNISISGWDSLKPHKIGIRRGTKFAETGTAGMKVQAVATNNQLFKILDADRVIVSVVARLDGLEEITKLNLNNVVALEPPLTTIELYHFLHKKNESLLPEIKTALEEMASSGRIQAIKEEILIEVTEK